MEPMFDVTKGAPSGLYNDGRYVKTWSDIKSEYPNAFRESTITGDTAIDIVNDMSYFDYIGGDLVIDSEITSIEHGAFASCYSLNNIIIPSSVTNIGEWAFADCNFIENIIFDGESSLQSIGKGAFRDLNIKTITIPAGVTSISTDAFGGFTKLKEVIFENVNSGTLSTYFNNDVFGDVQIVYIRQVLGESVDMSSLEYLTHNFRKLVTSDKTGYDMYVRNAE